MLTGMRIMWPSMLLIAATFLNSAPAAIAAADRYDELAATVLASTTVEWTKAFAAHGRAYAAPRLLQIDPPRHHPSRGFGYSPGVGVVIDRGEMADIGTVFAADAEALTALVIAHEVAHHVQYLNRREHSDATASAADREREADCAAGWWLGRANRRSERDTGSARFRVPDLDHELPRLFQALDLLGNGLPSARSYDVDAVHGNSSSRVSAFKYGLSVPDVAECGPSVAP